LALNAARTLEEAEQLELDEMQRLEHIIILFKAHISGFSTIGLD